MSETTAANSDTRPGFLSEVGGYLFKTVVYTPVLFLGMAVVLLPFSVTMLSAPRNEVSGLVFLTILSWAIALGQLDALRSGETGETDLRPIVHVVGLAASLIYYYGVTILALVLSVALFEAGYVEGAQVVAVTLPAADLYLSAEHDVGVGWFTLSFALWVGERLSEMKDAVWVNYVEDFVIVAQEELKRVIPEIYRDFSLLTMTRRRGG